jgi:hypothetical protein
MKKILFILLLTIPFFGFGQWTKFYHNNQMQFISNAEQTTDGGYIVSGVTKAPGSTSGGNDYDMIIMKTDINGDSLWSKVFGGYEEDVVNKIIQTSDGGYALVGYSENLDTNNIPYSFILKTDTNGDSLWMKPLTRNDEVFSFEQTSDGGYIYTGYASDTGATSVNFLLVKTDDLGNIIWWKKYLGSFYQAAAFNVQQTTDGGYIIGGVSVESNGSYDLFIIKTNDVGDTTWTRQIDNGEEGFGSIIQTTNGKYIVSSSTRNPIWNNYSDLTITELGINGNIISTTKDIVLENPKKNSLK